jgi:hypothetical protein
MAIQTLSLAAIINESQQGEQAARRAVPAAMELGSVGLPDPFGSQPEKKPVTKKDTGLQSTQEIQQELDKEAEAKKKTLEDAKVSTISTADSLQTVSNLDYTQTFLKIFGLA